MGVLTYNCKTKKTEYREYTPEEILEMEKQFEVENSITLLPPTESERLEALEAAILELAEVIANG